MRRVQFGGFFGLQRVAAGIEENHRLADLLIVELALFDLGQASLMVIDLGFQGTDPAIMGADLALNCRNLLIVIGGLRIRRDQSEVKATMPMAIRPE